MKYNNDIDPMKKEIGLHIERYLKSTGRDYRKYKYVAVDRCGDVLLIDIEPEIIEWVDVWCIPAEELGSSALYETKDTELIAYPLYSMDMYILENWKDLLFRLGDK